MITISAFNNITDFAKGLVRDMRVRWALEEAGTSLRDPSAGAGRSGQARLSLLCNHSGRCPSWRRDGLVLFRIRGQ